MQAISADYEGQPTWAGSFIRLGDMGAVVMFTDSDPDRDQTIRDRLASVADNVEIRTVTYALSELDTAMDALREAIPNDGWNELVTFWGPDIAVNRVDISLSDLDAAPTLHELIDLPELTEFFCIRPQAVEAGTPDEDA